ncbi:MAG TPA: 2-phospho-L-lactate guanylyltransferase [Actinomycetota bacterium]|nr:2-phospho-L-lactate guanylyltransferase [Actinomycetota bacterium]
MRVIAIPVKSLSRTKSRLGSELSPLERGALTLAMLEDVLDATAAVPGWETWVISPDEVVLEIAARREVRPVPEAKPPLSSAVRQAEALSLEEEATALAIIPGDLPLITPDALAQGLRTLGPVVLVRSTGEGTNLLLRRPPRSIPARFGPDSFRRHLTLAELRGLPASVVERPELSFDVDLPSDILTVLASERRGRTLEVCLEMDLAERLKVHA